MKKGFFITFEGTEGCGKSTQAKMLADYLEKNNIPYLLTREPGGDEVAEQIRNVILDGRNTEMTDETEALLYAAARSQHVANILLPALSEGKIVICDRYVHSSIAYQGYGRGLPLSFVLGVNEYAVKNCMPDVVFFLNMTPEASFTRKGGADKNDRLETSGNEFFKRVYNGFLTMSKQFDNFVEINPKGSREETSKIIIDKLKEKGIID